MVVWWQLAIYLAQITVVSALGSDPRLPYSAKYFPACYTDGDYVTYSNVSVYGCKHPLYSTCGTHFLCCGPSHYCCTLANGGQACCRRNPWTPYEIVGLVTGIVSWLCILTVLSACLGPQLLPKVASVLPRWNRKVHPQQKGSANQEFKMKQFK